MTALTERWTRWNACWLLSASPNRPARSASCGLTFSSQ